MTYNMLMADVKPYSLTHCLFTSYVILSSSLEIQTNHLVILKPSPKETVQPKLV